MPNICKMTVEYPLFFWSFYLYLLYLRTCQVMWLFFNHFLVVAQVVIHFTKRRELGGVGDSRDYKNPFFPWSCHKSRWSNPRQQPLIPWTFREEGELLWSSTQCPPVFLHLWPFHPSLPFQLLLFFSFVICHNHLDIPHFSVAPRNGLIKINKDTAVNRNIKEVLWEDIHM